MAVPTGLLAMRPTNRKPDRCAPHTGHGRVNCEGQAGDKQSARAARSPVGGRLPLQYPIERLRIQRVIALGLDRLQGAQSVDP